MDVEDEVMRYIGLDFEYPKRGTRYHYVRVMLLSWLVDVFHRRVLEDATLTADVLLATEKGLLSLRCQVCGTEYQLLQLDVYVPSRFLNVDGCCWGCPLLESNEVVLPALVRQLIDACGFIPESGTYFDMKSFYTRIPDARLLDVARIYRELGGFPYLTMKYDSWLKALLLSGVFGDRGRITPRGVICLADDGDVCGSLGELEIDNWLYRNRLPHVKEPKYPVHPKLNPRGLKRADWKVGDCYIEYFGLAGDKQYDKRTRDKLQLTQELGLQLLPIATKDLGRLDEVLRRLLL